MSINMVAISGNLGKDAELRRTQSGTTIVSFSVAVNEGRKNNQTGEWEEYTNWVSCSMFGTRAEKLAEYLKKGTKVSIKGKLRYSEWERDGQKRSKLGVIVDEIEFMSSKGGHSSGGQSVHGDRQENQPQEVIDVDASVYDDDIPF